MVFGLQCTWFRLGLFFSVISRYLLMHSVASFPCLMSLDPTIITVIELSCVVSLSILIFSIVSFMFIAILY